MVLVDTVRGAWKSCKKDNLCPRDEVVVLKTPGGNG